MKKLLAVVLTVVLMVSVIPFGMFSITASAATSGYYTYTVSNGGAEITDVDASISGVVTIPSTLGGYPVTSIGSDAFYKCTSLTSITIPDGVTSIGYGSFSGCSSLTSITIPDSVTSIGSYAFSGTGYYKTGSNWNNGVLYIGKHLIAAKQSISGTYAIKQGTLTIANFAFYNCSNLTSITIPDSVTSIDDSAFSGCTSLTSITIPDSVTSIGDYAFYNCDSLTSITIPDSVTSIGGSAFEGCSSLTSITIPDSVTSIGGSAFYGCTSLESITLPFVGQNADGTGFSNFGYIFGADDESYPCYRNPEYVPSSLKNVIITGSSSISEDAFYGCNYLQTVNFVGNVKIFADWVFNDCTGLKKVTLPASLTKIGAMTFYDCINLEDVYFLGAESQKNIQISHGNDMLEDVATWHYKSCYGSDQHSYSDGVICSVCGALKYTTGDLTGDDKINSLDGLMLLRHLNGWTLSIASPEAMDVNGDGKVNSLDGLMLLRYLNGWNITLG